MLPRIAALLLFTTCLHTPLQAAPQNTNLQDKINSIFNLTSSSRSTGKRGFGVVVTPSPTDPSQPLPDFQSISGRKQGCNCVPYHLCDPRTNSVGGSGSGSGNVGNTNAGADDGDFDGFGVIDLRFDSEDFCENFLDVCCDGNSTRTESINPKPVQTRPNRPQGCGIRNVGGLDFNLTGASNNEAGFGEFPWTVALIYASNNSYFCAGSLIHPSVVLTAVHCVINRPPASFIVRAGEWDSLSNRERLPYQERNVLRALQHPQYNPRNVANDYALLILDNAFALADHINVVCLPFENATPAPGTGCIATGWGKDIFGAAGRYNALLKRVELPIVGFDECQQRLRNTRLGQKFKLDRSMVCAGGEVGVDTCQGDGGAPLVCPLGVAGENRYQQSGIVAWGIGCNGDYPAAYANVAQVRGWIDSQMLANGFDTNSYSVN